MPVLQCQDACSGAAPVASIGRSPIVPPARPSAVRGVRQRIRVRAGAAKPRRPRVLRIRLSKDYCLRLHHSHVHHRHNPLLSRLRSCYSYSSTSTSPRLPSPALAPRLTPTPLAARPAAVLLSARSPPFSLAPATLPWRMPLRPALCLEKNMEFKILINFKEFKFRVLFILYSAY